MNEISSTTSGRRTHYLLLGTNPVHPTDTLTELISSHMATYHTSTSSSIIIDFYNMLIDVIVAKDLILVLLL